MSRASFSPEVCERFRNLWCSTLHRQHGSELPLISARYQGDQERCGLYRRFIHQDLMCRRATHSALSKQEPFGLVQVIKAKDEKKAYKPENAYTSFMASRRWSSYYLIDTLWGGWRVYEGLIPSGLHCCRAIPPRWREHAGIHFLVHIIYWFPVIA